MPDTEIQIEEVLERHPARNLTGRDRDIFLAMLEADEEPNEALRNAFETYRELILSDHKK